MVRVLNSWWAALVVYLLAVTGSAVLLIKLSSVVANQVAVLAQPYLDNSPPKLSLIQRRRIDAALALPPLPGRERPQIIAPEAPSTSAIIIAARLDVAEKEGFEPALAAAADTGVALKTYSQPSSIATRATKLSSPSSKLRHAALTTRDIFNRSFGVITVAAN